MILTGTWYVITWHLILDTYTGTWHWYLTPAFDMLYLTPDLWHVISDTGTWHVMLDIWYLTPAPDTLYLTTDPWHLISDSDTWHVITWYLIPDTWYPIPVLDMLYLTPDSRYLIYDTDLLYLTPDTWYMTLDNWHAITHLICFHMVLVHLTWYCDTWLDNIIPDTCITLHIHDYHFYGDLVWLLYYYQTSGILELLCSRAPVFLNSCNRETPDFMLLILYSYWSP